MMDMRTRFNVLAIIYIEDTCCDGQLFCGCRKEDCESFKTGRCIDCLIKHIEDTVEASTIKGIRREL